MVDKLKKLIEDAQKILVITHTGPDPDAFCSLILAGTTLELNYPDKQVRMSTEEQTGDLKPLAGYEKVRLQKLDAAINEHKPDLIIMVDAMNFGRCTRGEAMLVSQKVKERGIKLAIIDHHEPVSVEDNDVYINQNSPAAVQDVYETLFTHLGLKKPAGYAQTTLLGLYSDSGGFVYETERYKQMFNLVVELVAAGAKLETINSLLHQFSSDTMAAVAELSKNLSHEQDYSFSFVSDEFTNDWQAQGKNFDQLKLGVAHFVNEYIRNIDGRQWGFVIYKDLAAGDNVYGVSLRALGGTTNVAKIAEKLGGGGHIPSAGAKIKAPDVGAVLKQVQEAIDAA